MDSSAEVHEEDLDAGGDPQDWFYCYKGLPFSGVCYSTYDEGRRAKEVQYLDGLPNGTWKRWSKSGSPVSVSS